VTCLHKGDQNDIRHGPVELYSGFHLEGGKVKMDGGEIKKCKKVYQ